MNDDDIIKQRIAGKSVRAMAKAQRPTVSAVNEVIDRWAAVVVNSNLRQQALALELARLNELQKSFYERALAGDVPSGALVSKLIERR